MPNNNAPIILPPNARILIVKLRAGIGDGILFMPSVRALRETYPVARIDLLTAPGLEPLVENFQLFDTLLLHPPQAPLDKLLNNLRFARYDAALFFQHLLPSTRGIPQDIALATSARWNVGLDNGYGTFLNVKVHDGGHGVRHQAEYTMAVVEAVGAVVHDKRLFLPLGDEECSQARTILQGTETAPICRPVIAMHPGCGSYMKARRWASERFAQVADVLYKEFGGQLVLLGDSEESSFCG